MDVYEFERMPGEKVIAAVNEYKGRKLADLRIFYESDEGEWKPTKKGISVSTDQIEELEIAVQKLKENIGE